MHLLAVLSHKLGKVLNDKVNSIVCVLDARDADLANLEKFAT